MSTQDAIGLGPADAAAGGRVGAGTRRLLFVTRRPPYPLDNGARIRANRLLSGLSEAFATTLLTYAHMPGSPDGVVSAEELAEALPGVEIVMVPGLAPGKRLAQALSLARLRSWEFGRYRTRAFGNRLKQLLADRRPDIVHFDDLGVGSFAPLLGTLSVFAPHNVEHRILAANAGVARGPRRLFAEVERRKVRREERRLWREADMLLAVSSVDALAMRHGGAPSVELCPNGTDRVAQLAPPRRRADEPLRLLFVGSCSYRPYELGLAWFIREVYAPLAAQLPLSFDVVGQPPQRPLPAPGVVYHGRVPSVQPYYERAHAVVVPVFEGSGTRLKIVEAMAFGRPVLSTALGAEGLPIRPDEHYLAAEDPQGFGDALRALARMTQLPGELDAMLARARLAVEPLFWEEIVERLVELYAAMCASRSAPAAQPAAGGREPRAFSA